MSVLQTKVMQAINMNFGAGIALPLGADIKLESKLMKITVMKDYLLAETVNDDENPIED